MVRASMCGSSAAWSYGKGGSTCVMGLAPGAALSIAIVRRHPRPHRALAHIAGRVNGGDRTSAKKKAPGQELPGGRNPPTIKGGGGNWRGGMRIMHGTRRGFRAVAYKAE